MSYQNQLLIIFFYLVLCSLMHFLGNSREVANTEANQHTPYCAVLTVLTWGTTTQPPLQNPREWLLFAACAQPLSLAYFNSSNRFQNVPDLTATTLKWLKFSCPIHWMHLNVQAFNPRSFLFWRLSKIFIWQLNSITDVTNSHNWMLQNYFRVFSTCFCFWSKKWACPSTAHVKCNPHPI